MKRDLIWLSVFSAAAFAALATLGVWQLQRLAWKETLIARIEARARAEPVALTVALARWKENRDVEYLRVRIEGEFQHGRERHLFSVIGGAVGWHVVTPLETGSGHIVLIGRGFVPNALKAPEIRARGLLPGPVAVTGLARAPGAQGAFTPANEVVKNVWYWRDLQAMAASVLAPEQLARLVPFFIELDAAPVPGGWPKGGTTRVDLPNRHLQYALTWFALAGALLAVYAIYLRGRLGGRRSPKNPT